MTIAVDMGRKATKTNKNKTNVLLLTFNNVQTGYLSFENNHCSSIHTVFHSANNCEFIKLKLGRNVVHKNI